jgi:tetratricopeptide (TPR) repeat protein
MPANTRYRKGDTIGGQYLVHQALQGGMGEVYLCLDLQGNRPFALKTFQQKYHFDPKSRELFNEEVGTWIALEKHPNIVRCFWMQTLDNQPFMGLEWVAGEEGRGTDLRGWLRHGPLDLRLTLDFIIDICRGLIYANQKQPGIVHRDLKPDNILVSQGRLAKITDFGLAMVAQRANLDLADDEAADDHTTHQHTRRSGNIVGTLPYMPPEQWQGGNIDARADIYAVGCILYELLTGQFPYTATTPSGLRQQHEQAALPTLPSASGLPPALNDLLAGCLAKRPDDRFSDVAALLEAVTTLYRQQIGEEPRPQPEAGAFTAGDYSNRGNTYKNLGRYDEALADYTRAIERDPAYALAYNNRGVTYADLGRSEEALADYTRAIELDPADATAYSNRGVTYKNLGRTEEALADYTRAIERDPTLAQAYNNRGSTYDDLGRYEEALADFTRAIERDPTLAQAYSNRGVTYKNLGRSAEALADYTRAIERDPAYALAYNNRGLTYANLGRTAEALADHTRAIELDPTLAQAYSNRGLTYDDLGRSDEALADYTRAIERDPADATAYSNRGLTYHNLGRTAEALADYTRAIELDPADATAYYNRGVTYDDLGRSDEALADYTRAIELDPADAQAYSNRGATYANLGRTAEALADYTRAIELDPADTKAYTNLGALLGNQGKHREALSYFEKAAQLGDPNGAKYAAIARQQLGIEEVPPAQQAFNALVQAGSLDEIRQAVAQFPFMTGQEFIQSIEQVIAQQVPPEQRQPYEQRLDWLQQIASEQGKQE